MAGYSFVGLNDKKGNTKIINTESPKFVDFGFLENKIAGLTILSVTGRELIPKTILSHTFDNMDGQYFLGSKFEPRELEFTYLLKANTSADFVRDFTVLSSFLVTPQLTFSFVDENLFYTGTLTEIGDVDAGKLSVVSTFKFTCSDPFRYGATKNKTANDTLVLAENETDFFNLDVIDTTINVNNVSGNSVKLSIANYSMEFSNSDITNDSIIKIDFKKNNIYLNGSIRNDILTINSDFENIILDHTAVFLSSGNNISVNYRTKYI